MVGIMMNGLRRLHQLTGDRRAADAIVGAARWLLSHTWDTGQRLFLYTPCPNLGAHGAAVGNTQQVVEGLGYAWRLTRDDAVADTILAALPPLAQPRLASTPEEAAVSATGCAARPAPCRRSWPIPRICSGVRRPQQRPPSGPGTGGTPRPATEFPRRRNSAVEVPYCLRGW